MDKSTKCALCPQKAVVHLKYFNRKLCKQHFSELTQDRIRKNISKNELVDKNNRVAVAVSGGKDSTTLLYSLANFAEKFPIELVGITIDEGIEGYRSESLKVVEKNYKKLGIEYKILRYENEVGKPMDEIVKKDQRLPCSYCGVFRRDLLNKAALEVDADKIATGHNLDDEVQSILMNYIRGDFSRLARTGTKTAADTGFVQRIKPLSVVPEKEIALYAMLNNFEVYWGECPYSHEAFRSEIRDTLNRWEERSPGTKYQIYNGAENLKELLKGAIGGAILFECEICGTPSPSVICKSCEMKKEVR
ncbi:TPA: TIGR00269 family protein [archaeon]|uniref:TIGR00269 family protein n=1 Tax=Candidatus Naiadarchaeum limnaeum TaxID=2756139 RepID=A0A832XJ07_9ARCH|nr:TIGR00269 family protein [Candidatus Naiadarchaeales archaeon SRR2090153.bin1042]HIJ99946.1 TIGR00269 family protein [Candidatus Naiadarchaeum limnaeum]